MDISSNSSSSSSEDEKSAQNLKESRTSSGSDFEARPVSKGGISPKPTSAVSKHSPEPKTNATMNANVIAAMAKGTSKDFLTKMNAAMQRNFPPKLQLPTKKLTRIGFDNDQSSSSDNKKSPSKTTTNTLSASTKSSNLSNLASEDTKNQSRKKDSSSSDSDSGNESDAKRKALLLKHQQSMTKTTSEDNDSDSSDTEKKQPKVLKQVSFSVLSTVFADKNPQVKVPNKSTAVLSESDSDSEDESKAKRIEEIKMELKKLEMSRKRRKSTCDDSDSSAVDEKSSARKVISSTKSLKTEQISSKSDSDESDDTKMTSIMTQRETPSKKSGVKGEALSASENSSDSSKDADPSANNSGNIHRSGKDSDAEDNSLIKRDKTFSQFLNENIDYREIKIKSSFDPALLNKGDEIYSCNVPKHIPPELLRNKEFFLDKLTTLNLGGEKYNIKAFKTKKQSLCLINRHKNTSLVKLDLAGHIKVFKTPEKVEINKQVNLAELSNEKKVATPKLKERHPLFGADLKKVTLSETVQNRLDTMIEDLNKKIARSKKKKNKLEQDEDNVQVIKEDIYKMLNFLQETTVQNASKIDGSKVEKSPKSKKKSAKNIEIQVQKVNDVVFAEPLPKKSKFEDLEHSSSEKSKTSKLKLNLLNDDGIESKSDDIDVQKDAKSNKKSKITKHIGLANSTFASPSISSKQKIFETNESIIHAETSRSLKHLEKIIKKVAKGKIGNDFVTTNVEFVNDTNNLEHAETVTKKKKKKSKNISKEI